MFCFFAFSNVHSVILDCNYQVQTLWMIQSIYACSARVIVVGDLRNVTEVSQNHVVGFSNEDVKGIVIEGQNLRFEPRNLETFFPNLEAFDIYRSQIQEILKGDIESLRNLRQLNLVGNNIQAINSNLFESNLKMTAISFSTNPIRNVDHKVFDHLEELSTLAFTETSCINLQYWNNRAGVLHLTFQIIVSCPPSFEMTQAKLLSGSEFQRTIDEKVAERTNPLTWNIFEMDQTLQSRHDARIENLEGQLLKVNQLLEKALNGKL